MYTEKKFKKLNVAVKAQRAFKEDYGYKPSIFRIKPASGNKPYYAIVKPHGIKRIR